MFTHMLAVVVLSGITFISLPAIAQHADDPVPADPAPRWWKGNIHTHTLWSDGNDFPEMVCEWYRTHGYNFLALSDHNVLSEGIRWFSHREVVRRGGKEALAKYLARFGEHWVETRGSLDDGSLEIRLKPLNEFRPLMEGRGKFILIQGEEITDSFARLYIHINATNLRNVIPPQHGNSVVDTIRNNLRAVQEQAKETGQPILAHLNHPNFGWAITAEEIAEAVEERFFEVFNGHTSVHNRGDETRAGTERMWDIANAIRLIELNAPPLYGLATDDSHSYHGEGDSTVSIPGRGWVMVRSRHLTPESLIRAMQAGDFYASTGVALDDVSYDDESRTLHVAVHRAGDEKFVIAFIGTRHDVALLSEPVLDNDGNEVRTTRRYLDSIGEILKVVDGPVADYTLTGDELYVRAVVTSSGAPDNPTADSPFKQAWTQPVGWQKWIVEVGAEAPLESAGD